MNQSQRTFLINKIKEQVSKTVKLLNESIPKEPEPSSYLLEMLLSGKLTIKSPEEIKDVLLRRYREVGVQEWLGSRYAFSNTAKTEVVFKVADIFIMPDDYVTEKERRATLAKQIEEQIHSIQIQGDSLITRIQLASDKTLQTMINEVDDMGNISLMETKLKLLQQ